MILVPGQRLDSHGVAGVHMGSGEVVLWSSVTIRRIESEEQT